MRALDELVSRWRELASKFRQFGQEPVAAALERCASEAATCYQEWLLEELSLQEAAAYSGLAYCTVQEKVSSGELPNQGKKGSPRVRRCDLPAKPPGSPDPDEEGVLDLMDRIRHAKSTSSVAANPPCA